MPHQIPHPFPFLNLRNCWKLLFYEKMQMQLYVMSKLCNLQR